MHLNTTTVNTISGALSGVVVSVIMSPLDVIKTRIQVKRLPKGVPDHPLYKTIYNLYKQEGVRAFYKGLGTTLTAYAPNWAIFFCSYQYAKTKWAEVLPNTTNPSVINMLSSVTAGAICNILTAPLWTARTRMQTQRGYDDYKNTVDTFRKIYQQEGLKALYRGVVPSMFGLIHVGIQFPTYEYLLAKQAQLRHEEVKDLTAGQVFVASALSKVIASVIAYPHEVLRSRLQDANHAIAANDKPTEFKKYSGVTDAIRTIWKDEGPRAFYRGMGANLLRTVPAAVITLSSYEAFRKALMKIGDA